MEAYQALSGFFGCVDSDALRIPVHRCVKKIRLELVGDQKEILNLKGLELTPSVSGLKYKCRQSSIHESQKRNSYSLINKRSIHTKAEYNPFWEIIFEVPVHIDLLKILNRPDKWGRRTQNLMVSCLDDSGEPILLRKLGSAAEKWAVLDFFFAYLGFSSYEHISLDHLKSSIMNVICKDSALPMEFYRKAIQYVGVWSSSNSIGEYDSTVIAGYLIKQERMSPGQTSLKMFSAILCSVSVMDKIQLKMRELCEIYNVPPYSITRHGVEPVNILASNGISNLELMRKVVSTYQNLGYPIVLGYGTLLGAVRGQQFLPHDDDIDLIYFSKENSQENVRCEIKNLMLHFQSLGYRISHAINRRFNIHIIDDDLGVKVDVFPCWPSKDGYSFDLHMHKMKIETIDHDCLMPLGQVCLEGESFPAPANYRKFLHARYGENWETEDPYFDWPWLLSE